MSGLPTALGAYLATRLSASPWRSRPAFEAWQQRKLDNWLKIYARRAAFYANMPPYLSAIPVIDKATVMKTFAAFNVPGITAAQAWDALNGARRIGPYTVGASTGTSGNRGLFVISERERFLWLGTILAKALPDFWRMRPRVAIVLPMHTRLYESANETGRIALSFFDLGQPMEVWLPALIAFKPAVLVAPPKVLRYLADTRVPITPARIFSAAETLDPMDRHAIQSHFKGRFGEIYMATEGLLGVTCAHGTMHLAEDSTVFEFEPTGSGGLVTPVITNFRRTTQIMARYRMNDLLRLSEQPCRCGSPLRAVREIVGRMDDIFELHGERAPVLLTPDILRNTVLDADRSITDFRLKCLDAGHVLLLIPPETAEGAAQAALSGLSALFARHGASAMLTLQRERFGLDTTRKLRRVENLHVRRAS